MGSLKDYSDSEKSIDKMYEKGTKEHTRVLMDLRNSENTEAFWKKHPEHKPKAK